MKIHAMIAEDERLAAEELAYHLQQEPDVVLLPRAENGEQILTFYEAYQPDVIFLDIHMPGLSGLEAARVLCREQEQEGGTVPLFVFTTAYEEYGVQAFEIDAVDYLLKPYDEKRFQVTMGRVRKFLQRKAPAVPPLNKLVVSAEDKMIVVEPQNISFAVRSGKSLAIHQTDGTVIETKMNLQELESKLRGYPFYRPHRSYLVNLNEVAVITPWFNGAYNLMLKDQKKSEIPVSRGAAKGLFRALYGGHETSYEPMSFKP